MTTTDVTTARGARVATANGIDIHYVEAGAGPDLVLLHGGMVSTAPVWAQVPVAYVGQMEELSRHFHVIAPETRGCGATEHAGDGEITFDLLADDVLALIEVLGLDRPAIAGFSDGGHIALVAALHDARGLGPIVCHAGFDLFEPDAPSTTMLRTLLGGRPDATEADPDAAAAAFGAGPPEMAMAFELLRADLADARGEGYWREYLSLNFPRLSQWCGYGFDDLGRIEPPTLVLVGDRDDFCPVEQAVTTYRALPAGALSVLPAHGHHLRAASLRMPGDFVQAGLA